MPPHTHAPAATPEREWTIAPAFRKIVIDDAVICERGGLLSMTVASDIHTLKPSRDGQEVAIKRQVEAELLFTKEAARKTVGTLMEWVRPSPPSKRRKA